MEASSLTHASRGGLLGRRSPLLKLQGDERLVAMIRAGHEHAFEVLFDRYHSRLLAFCRHMLRSTEDAEDVLQEVFVKAHAAMLADERPINARPWLYRIARNRCLNHLRRPVADGVDTMDVLPSENGVTTADRVQKREDFRALVEDVSELPETQRTALLLRELDALSYEEIATAMDTTVPAVKSLLVRARMSLAEATHSRQLTCGEVRLELAEAAEGLRKATGPVRHHIKRCEPCREFRGELRHNAKALAAIAPLGPIALFHQLIIGKLSGLFGGSSGAAGGSTAAGGSAVAGTGAAAIGAGGAATGAGVGGAAAAGAGATGAAVGGGGLAVGGAAAGGIGGALGAKAAVTAATAALLTAGAVEVRHISSSDPPGDIAKPNAAFSPPATSARGTTFERTGTITLATVTATPAHAVAQPNESAATPPATEQPPTDTPEAPPADPAVTPPVSPPPDEDVVSPSLGGTGSLQTGDAEATTAATVAQATDVTGSHPGPVAAPPPPAAATPTSPPTPEPTPVEPTAEPGQVPTTPGSSLEPGTDG
jgi:RNA polymerase sigma factor (sigma-70 family)